MTHEPSASQKLHLPFFAFAALAQADVRHVQADDEVLAPVAFQDRGRVDT
ncbi:hypothetical protein GCM10010277_87780 [Streptomyces longisporoflavus]|nr:hypothetical protein GCM10010277_87780 [Streptomyces longisporoflavus]